MNQKQAKNIRRSLKRNSKKLIHAAMDDLLSLPFFLRLQIAFRIVRGK